MPSPRFTTVTVEQLIELPNEDLSREYQAMIAYVNYSQVMKGPQFMAIVKELEKYAHEEHAHALINAGLIDYLVGMPTFTPSFVKQSKNAEKMHRFNLENENTTAGLFKRANFLLQIAGRLKFPKPPRLSLSTMVKTIKTQDGFLHLESPS